jgi:hypothetical protein
MNLKLIFANLALAVAFSSTSFAAIAETGSSGGLSPIEQAGVNASTKKIDETVLRALVFNLMLSERAPMIVDIPREVQNRWNSIRVGILGSPFIASTAGGTSALGKSSADKFESISQPITTFFRAIGASVNASGEVSADVARALRIDWVLEQSSVRMERSFDFIKPIVELFVQKGSLYSVGTGLGLSSLGISFYLAFKDPNEALTISQIRSLVGYNAVVMKRIDQAAADLAVMYNVDAAQQAQFKRALFDHLIEMAAKRKFDRNGKYTLDVIDVLKTQGLITNAQWIAARDLSQIVKIATRHPLLKLSEIKTLASRVDLVTSLCAFLEAQVQSERLTREDEREANQLLLDARRNLRLVQTNMQYLGTLQK